MNLKAELLRERLALYVRLRGGYPFPLAGAIWWAAMAVLGTQYSVKSWTMLAFIGSGLIFPLALLLSIWVFLPEGRTTWLPASVAVAYILTVGAILIDTRRLQRRVEVC